MIDAKQKVLFMIVILTEVEAEDFDFKRGR
jgi:hypothetical protein